MRWRRVASGHYESVRDKDCRNGFVVWRFRPGNWSLYVNHFDGRGLKSIYKVSFPYHGEGEGCGQTL